MSEFVGRTGSQRVYSYPETRRSGDVLSAFARNFATGPKVTTGLSGDTLILWNAIDSFTATPSTDVNITPRSTGILLITGVVSIQNGGGGPVSSVVIEVQIDGVPLPVPAFIGLAPIAAGESISLPFMAEAQGVSIGVTAHVQILVNGDGADIIGEGSTLSVQEVSAATG